PHPTALRDALPIWALQSAGASEVEGPDGERAILSRGRLLHAWRAGSHPPLRAALVPEKEPILPAPPDALAADEAHLLWKWVTAHGSRLVDADAPLALPARPVPSLESRVRYGEPVVVP